MATHDKEHIARYLAGELEPQERQQLEADMQSDAVLAAEVALYKEAMATLQQRLPADEGVIALRSSLQQLGKAHFARPARVVAFRKYVAGMAAAAAVILAVVLLWPSGKGDYIDRFGATTMSAAVERGDNADSLIQQAAVYFNQQAFDKALPMLNKAVKADSTDQSALFYRGVTQLHLGAVAAAQQDLEKVYKGESILQYEAAFYMALGYAQQKNAAAARLWLQKIPEGTPVTEKAKALQRQLK